MGRGKSLFDDVVVGKDLVCETVSLLEVLLLIPLLLLILLWLLLLKVELELKN